MTTSMFRELKTRYGDVLYRSNMDHPSYRRLLDEFLQEQPDAEYQLGMLVFPDAVDLSKLTFTDVSFHAPNFKDANLERTMFINCTIDRADFSTAQFTTTRIMTSRMSSCAFGKRNMFGLFLHGTTLYNNSFKGTDLTGVSMQGCKTNGHNNWDGARLQWANHNLLSLVLQDAAMTEEQRITAWIPEIFPERCYKQFLEMDIPSHMRRWVIEQFLSHIGEDDLHYVPSFLYRLKQRAIREHEGNVTLLRDQAIVEEIDDWIDEQDDDDDDDDDEYEDDDEE